MQLMARQSPGEIPRPLLQTAWRVVEVRSTMAPYAQAAGALGACLIAGGHSPAGLHPGAAGAGGAVGI
eukprot:331459-Pyramimonas_sp.AAC.1